MHLPPQSVIIHNSAWGVIRLKVRPPRSKVWEFSPEATRNIVSSTKTESLIPSDQAQHILEIVKAHRRSTGEGINLSAVAQKSGITSKRRIQQLIDELERGGHIKTRRLLKRGLPRIVEPISNGGAD